MAIHNREQKTLGAVKCFAGTFGVADLTELLGQFELAQQRVTIIVTQGFEGLGELVRRLGGSRRMYPATTRRAASGSQ